ncbi:hypothetical protein ACP4OV_008856 [Aristida adscensionis]
MVRVKVPAQRWTTVCDTPSSAVRRSGRLSNAVLSQRKNLPVPDERLDTGHRKVVIDLRFSPFRLVRHLPEFDDVQKKFIEDSGFGSLLKATRFKIPIDFLGWIMRLYSMYSVNGKYPINKCEELLKGNHDKVTFVRTFLLLVISSIFLPTKNNDCPVKYLHSLADISMISKLDWAEVIINLVMKEVKRYQDALRSPLKPNTKLYFEGCIPLLAVIYIDFLDLTGQNCNITYNTPRMFNLSKTAIDSVILADKNPNDGNSFGALPIRDISLTPYAGASVPPSSAPISSHSTHLPSIPVIRGAQHAFPNARRHAQLGRRRSRNTSSQAPSTSHEIDPKIQKVVDHVSSVWKKEFGHAIRTYKDTVEKLHQRCVTNLVSGLLAVHSSSLSHTPLRSEMENEDANTTDNHEFEHKNCNDDVANMAEPPNFHGPAASGHVNEPVALDSAPVVLGGSHTYAKDKIVDDVTSETVLPEVVTTDAASRDQTGLSGSIQVTGDVMKSVSLPAVEEASLTMAFSDVAIQHVFGTTEDGAIQMESDATSRQEPFNVSDVQNLRDVSNRSNGSPQIHIFQASLKSAHYGVPCVNDHVSSMYEELSADVDVGVGLNIAMNYALDSPIKPLDKSEPLQVAATKSVDNTPVEEDSIDHELHHNTSMGQSTIDLKNRKKRKALHPTIEPLKAKVDHEVEEFFKLLKKKAVYKRRRQSEKQLSMDPPFVDIGAMHVSYSEFYDSLKNRGELGDAIFSCFCNLFNTNPSIPLTGPSARRKIVFSPFLTSFKFSICFMYLELKKLEESVKFSTADLLFFPVIVQDHWVLICINHLYGTINFFDSASITSDADRVSMIFKVSNNFVKACLDAGIYHKPFQYDEELVLDYPKQPNTFDCGMYVITYIENWDGKQMRKFDQDYIVAQRMNLAFKLVHSDQNEAKSLELLKSKKK